LKVVENILELIGNTPLIRLKRLPPKGGAIVLAKVEAFNPGGSIKDRIALALIEKAEAEGELKPGDTIVEATAGNIGISLAMVAAAKGYPLILVMPESVSLEHRKLLLQFGAQVVLTPATKGMAGAIEVARRLAERDGYFQPLPFDNVAAPEAHRLTTAPEIIKATQGRIDAFVAGIGTGSTITGVGEVLKREIPQVIIIGVEPARSPLLSQGKIGAHNIPGLGANFIPPILNQGIIDEIMVVDDEEARGMTLALAREEGILAGISSGANVFAALKVAERLGEGKTVVTILPDTGERYLNLALITENATEISYKGK
jgi:cysteine synthase A